MGKTACLQAVFPRFFLTGPILAQGTMRRPVSRPAHVPFRQLQPLVPPQVLHFMQVPFRTSV